VPLFIRIEFEIGGQQLGFKAKNKANSGKNGGGIAEVPLSDSLSSGIHEIYNGIPIRQVDFTLPTEDFETVHREEATSWTAASFWAVFLRHNSLCREVSADETLQLSGLIICLMIKHGDNCPRTP